MRRHHLIIFLLLSCLLAVSTAGAAPASPAPPAEDSARREQLQSAWRAGLQALRRDIVGAPFSTELSIGQVVNRLGLGDELDRALQSAEQPGGPRWIAPGVCQVRVELEGDRVAEVLAGPARQRPRELGMPREALERRLANLRTQRFRVIGTSTPVAPASAATATTRSVQMIEPGPTTAGVENEEPISLPPAARLIPQDPPRWAARQMDADGKGAGSGLKGARAAEGLAMAQLRKQVEELELSPGVTVGQAAGQDPRIAAAVAAALRLARTSRVEYGAELVEVRMSLDLEHLWRALVSID